MTTKQKKPSAFMRPVDYSEELADVIGPGPLPRTEITKKLWDYIKRNGLQDSTNKRMINPDPKLSRVFGSSQSINMFAMTRKVSEHIIA